MIVIAVCILLDVGRVWLGWLFISVIIIIIDYFVICFVVIKIYFF